jgi:uncharacterized protein with PQ loop repeat
MTALLGALATAYGMGAGVSSLLQARRMRQRGTSADVSLGFLGSYLGGYAIWLTYGLSIGSMPLIVVDAVGLVCGGLTLLVAVRLRRSPEREPRATAAVRPAQRRSAAREGRNAAARGCAFGNRPIRRPRGARRAGHESGHDRRLGGDTVHAMRAGKR